METALHAFITVALPALDHRYPYQIRACSVDARRLHLDAKPRAIIQHLTRGFKQDRAGDQVDALHTHTCSTFAALQDRTRS